MTDTTDESRRAQKAPLPPDVLADALHDRTHENSGRLLHASPIVVSDNAALLRDLDSAAAGVQRLDRLDAEHIAKTIRALEAKVRSEGRRAVLLQTQWHLALRQAQANGKIASELRADRDRIAAELRGTQTRLSEMAGEVERWKYIAEENRSEIARLTSELREAKINAGNFAVIDAGQPISDTVPTYEAMAAELAAAREAL